MNSRERMLRVLKFNSVDRIPLVEWNIREATMREWEQQGYPRGVNTKSFFDLDPYYIAVPISFGMHPKFEIKIIEQDERYKVWQDQTGAIRKDFSTIENPGFVTRSWLSFPVHNRESFIDIKKRYISGESRRYPENWKNIAKTLSHSSAAVHLSVPFLFWTAREWMGFEKLCLAFYDMPELIEEMFEFITDFCIETIERGIRDVKIDIVEFKEDMAYKNAPMISPEMFRKYFFLHYRRIIDFLKSNGVKIVYVDCDGYPGKLIPLWIEAGVDALSPCEIAAGNDMLLLRKEYPNMAFMGGIDKRVLAKDKKAVYVEVMSKVPALIERGGYIPHIDHAVPYDATLENYIYFRKLLREVAYGKLPTE